VHCLEIKEASLAFYCSREITFSFWDYRRQIRKQDIFPLLFLLHFLKNQCRRARYMTIKIALALEGKKEKKRKKI
jgi:hypothetical protein